jgi:hypothetical protein
MNSRIQRANSDWPRRRFEMGKIVGQIRLFNSAFRIAWDLAAKDGKLSAGIGPKLSDAISRIIKDGGSDPDVIGAEAYRMIGT